MPREYPKVSILITTSSRSDLLLKCLASLRAHCDEGLSYEVVVVMNGAQGDSIRDLQLIFSEATVVQSPVNLGLAGGSNLARSYAKGEYIALLHDDTEIEANWLESLLNALESDPHLGLVGSKTLFSDGRLQHAGSLLWRDGMTDPVLTEVATARPVDYVGTCALLIRSGLFDHIGGLDEQFYPAYYIDVDLAMSVRSAGFYVAVVPQSIVRHHRGSSSTPLFAQLYFSINRKRFVNKWHRELQDYCERPEAVTAEAQALALQRTEVMAQRLKHRPRTTLSAYKKNFDRDRQQLVHIGLQTHLLESFAKFSSELLQIHYDKNKALRPTTDDALSKADLVEIHVQLQRIASQYSEQSRQIGQLEGKVADLSQKLDRIAAPLRKFRRFLTPLERFLQPK